MSNAQNLSVTLLAGGVGGAKMAEGLTHLPGVDLTIIGNVADDDTFHGLWVSPDIDTMIYTLCDRIDRVQGWGVEDEGLRALSILKELGQDTWMTLGDKDLGLHIFRTMRLAQGASRQQVTDEICRCFDMPARLLLPTEDVIQTRVRTPKGWQSFQEYFVRDQCGPDVLELRYQGQDEATPNPAAIDALKTADVVVIAPSNPLMSIHPILGIPRIKDALSASRAPKIAVSPLVGGKAIKGPADKILKSLGFVPSNESIAAHYAGLVDALVVDQSDEADLTGSFPANMQVIAEQTVMKSREDKVHLANQLLETAEQMRLSEVLV